LEQQLKARVSGVITHDWPR